MQKNSPLKAFLGIKYTPQGMRLNLAFLGHVQQQKGPHQKPLVETGVEGSYIPLAFRPRHCLPLSQLRSWALCFLFLQVFFLLNETFPNSAVSTALWILC